MQVTQQVSSYNPEYFGTLAFEDYRSGWEEMFCVGRAECGTKEPRHANQDICEYNQQANNPNP